MKKETFISEVNQTIPNIDLTDSRALKICEVPETYRYDKYTRPTKMAA